ncbi:hypothetical protein H4582DRAFT_1944190, partial [Lactarius indigo]
MTNLTLNVSTCEHRLLHKPCAMFRQSLRHSVSPIFRSGPARAQPAARAYHRAHCFWRPPFPPPHRCIRLHVPIQATTALVQLCQSCHSKHHTSSRSFHSTQRVEGTPLLGFLVVAFKSSAVLEVIRTAGRVALTFIPVLLVKNHASRRILKKIELVKKESGDSVLPNPVKEFVGRQGHLLHGIRRRTILFHALIFTAMHLILGGSSWRLILLSPEEEDGIATQLAGSGWYQADTLRTLEAAIPKLGDEKSLAPVWLERGNGDVPLPPPAEYPLRPRPRAAEYVRQLMNSNWSCPNNLGPPASNPPDTFAVVQALWRHFRLPTTDLAILLAHELSHLFLVTPPRDPLLDLIRALVFPITMLLGPFVNDAFADLGKAGSWELSKLGDYCTTMKQEIEADVVSARLLAHAGFDPRSAVRFWEDRADVHQASECVASAAFDSEHREEQAQSTFALRIMGSGHPMNQVRVEELRKELDRWRTERERVLTELREMQGGANTTA